MNLMRKIFDYYLRSLWLQHVLVLAAFIVLSFIINRPPHGTFIAGGDFYQLLNPQDHSDRYFYGWINQTGQGTYNTLFVTTPFYAILGYFGAIATDPSLISSLIFFIFTYGSFLAFFLSIKSIFPTIGESERWGASLVYALNNFVITIFTYPWGFGHHFLYYIFIPPLIACFYRAVTTNSPRSFAWLTIAVVLSTISLGNLAFIGVTLLLQFVLLVFLVYKRIVRINKPFWLTIGKLAIVYTLSLSLVVWAWLSSLGDYLGDINTTKTLGGSLTGWLKATSSNFLNTFSFALDSSRFPTTSTYLSASLSLFYFGLIFYLVWRLVAAKKEESSRELQSKVSLFLMLTVIFVALSVRIYGSLSTINEFIYNLPLFNVFRSPDKLFTVLPFLYLVTLLGLTQIAKLKKQAIIIIFSVLLIIPFPIYSGAIPRELSETRNGSPYHYTIKIPEEYLKAKEIIDSDNKQTAVVSLPYSIVNSIGWSNYPHWGYVGFDALHLLYGKRYISSNVYDHPLVENTTIFQKLVQADQMNEADLRASLENFGAEFVIVHKDVDSKWLTSVSKFQVAFSQLEANSVVTKKYDNDYFTLYQLGTSYQRPIIEGEKSLLKFTKINPGHYELEATTSASSYSIIFRQSYSSKWKLFSGRGETTNCQTPYKYSTATECQHIDNSRPLSEVAMPWLNRPIEAKHATVANYANKWDIDVAEAEAAGVMVTKNPDGSTTMKMDLYFTPQSYSWLFFIVNSLILLLAALYIIVDRRNHVKR